MENSRLSEILQPYNPWWGGKPSWKLLIPDFERPIVRQILSDLEDIPQIVSITGPRRVGKSTALRQVIHHLRKRKFAIYIPG